MSGRFFSLLAALLVLGGGKVRAASADEDWQAVIALDSGPRAAAPKSSEAAGQMVLAHLARQDKALRGFLAAHPEDLRVFEAQLRLARLLQIRADFEGNEKLRAESKRLLDQLEKAATPEQRPELEFAKVARLMRALRPGNIAQRDEVLKAAREFQGAYPKDRRLAELLVEVATLFDGQPKTKELLLEDAQALATDEELKGRVADDLKRVRLLGTEILLRFTSVQGTEIDLAALRGKPVFLIYFAEFSPASATALGQLQQALAELPRGSVRVVGVCLDEKRETLNTLLKKRGVTWPVAWDGKGWQSPLARDFGINALPTVWLIDARGKLRVLNALEGAAIKARQLLQER